LGAAGIRRVSIDAVFNDVVLLREPWGIRKQRGKLDAMMKAARIRNRHGKESEATGFVVILVWREFFEEIDGRFVYVGSNLRFLPSPDWWRDLYSMAELKSEKIRVRINFLEK
jgi:hypothetical protein